MFGFVACDFSVRGSSTVNVLGVTILSPTSVNPLQNL